MTHVDSNTTPRELPATSCIAFEGTRRIATGALNHVALQVKAVLDRGQRGPVLIFDNATSELIEIDTRGSAEQVAARLPAVVPTLPAPVAIAAPIARKPGRPRLGVVAHEVTLLPRHWEWLNRQPGRASVALRKLVEEARRGSEGKDRVRFAQESAYRFMSAMAGNEPGFEEALRCLFAVDKAGFDALVERWPIDVRDHVRRLASGAFADGKPKTEE